MGSFERDTAVSSFAGDAGGFDCAIDPSWWVVAGPNGGYLAAIAVRAFEAHLGATEWPLRSLTMHYLRAPEPGTARVEVIVERQGRSVTFARARVAQDDRPCATAVAVLAEGRDSIELADVVAPDVARPDSVEVLPQTEGPVPPFAEHFHFRPAIEAAEGRAMAGGWLRLRDKRELDQPLVTALCDSWFPAVFALGGGPMAVPTLDLTVHLRAPLPRPDDWVLGRFRTRVIGDGLLEEDGELFSTDGRLLAQSRQLALAR